MVFSIPETIVMVDVWRLSYDTYELNVLWFSYYGFRIMAFVLWFSYYGFPIMVYVCIENCKNKKNLILAKD